MDSWCTANRVPHPSLARGFLQFPLVFLRLFPKVLLGFPLIIILISIVLLLILSHPETASLNFLLRVFMTS